MKNDRLQRLANNASSEVDSVIQDLINEINELEDSIFDRDEKIETLENLVEELLDKNSLLQEQLNNIE